MYIHNPNIDVHMKKQLIILSTFCAVLLLSISQLTSNPTGAPAPVSGGPAESGATCSQNGCHNGTPTVVSDILTTTIPAEGYTPGVTYDINVNIAGSGRKGFMVSAQNAGGSFLGTLIAGTGSKIAFSSYITHSSDKSTNPATWAYKWTAPAASSGPVTFYGSFAVTRNATRTQTVTVQENTATSVSESVSDIQLMVFPNPVIDVLSVSFNLKQAEHTTILLSSIDGKKTQTLYAGKLLSGAYTNQFNIAEQAKGLYILTIQTPTTTSHQKMLIGQ